MKNYIISFVYSLFFVFNLQAQTYEQRKIIQKQSISNFDIEKKIQSYNSNIYGKGSHVKYNLYDPQQYTFDGVPIFFKTYNISSANMLNTTALYPGANSIFNITGQNIVIGVWDEGKVLSSHIELKNKIDFGDASEFGNLSRHATHVTGTIISSGINDINSKGIAYASHSRVYDWAGDVAEISQFAQQGYLVSNHSYGYDVKNLPIHLFGKYDTRSMNYDNIMYNNPFYQIVVAAGNDRNDNSLIQLSNKFGYDLLTGGALSKNALVIGAINKFTTYQNRSSLSITPFSNYGPTDDGRIKPDVVAYGSNVYSLGIASDMNYTYLSGTSMAAPSISGLISLMQQYHFDVNSNYMKSHSVRALIIHSAREAGTFIGPDYEYGFGIPDAYVIASIISNQNQSNYIFETYQLSNTNKIVKNFSIDKVQNLTFTIAWTDPAAETISSNEIDIRTPNLVDNLDIKVYRLNPDQSIATTYYPWSLNPVDPTERATRNKDNDVDNVEKLFISNAPIGDYKIEITHKGTLIRDQEFTLVATLPGGNLSSQNFSQANLKLYPNPVVNTLYISGADFDILNNAIIQIFTLDGKLVSESVNLRSKSEINVSNLSSGFYIIKITSSGKSFSSKFIKK